MSWFKQNNSESEVLVQVYDSCSIYQPTLDSVFRQQRVSLPWMRPVQRPCARLIPSQILATLVVHLVGIDTDFNWLPLLGLPASAAYFVLIVLNQQHLVFFQSVLLYPLLNFHYVNFKRSHASLGILVQDVSINLLAVFARGKTAF